MPTTEAPKPLYYFVRLIPPRPDFPFTLSDSEREAMSAHADYWREHMRQGRVIVAGPVNDPDGAWGLGVLKVASEAELHEFETGDPVMHANIGMRYEAMPLLSIMLPA